MQTLRVNHLCKMLALFLVIFTAGVAAASEDIHRFQQALTLHPDQLEERFPIVVDWIRQDGGPEWQRIVSGETAHLPLIVARIIDQLDALDVATDHLRSRLEKITDQASSPLWAVYLEAAERRRTVRLKDLVGKWGSVVFAEHHNFQMGFIGYTEGLSDARHQRFFAPGAVLTLLKMDGIHATVTPLVEDPHGLIRDADVSPDGERILFAWKKSDRLDDYHIYEYDLTSGETRQLTFGLGRADYEPLYLPNGDIVFASTRPEQSVPCFWTEISNLYRMDANGGFIRRLAIDQVHTIYPTLLENGRMIYTRWDYSDRGQNFPQPLFTMNQDGAAQRVYYGGNSWYPTSLLHARAIPGTGQIMAVASGHHTRQRGKLVRIDVNQGRDEGRGMSFVAPRRPAQYERVDMAMQGGEQFRYPFPLDDRQFLVSYDPDGGSLLPPDDGHYGLYWMDVDGNREYLYRSDGISVSRPVTLASPFTSQPLADDTDYRAQTGEYYVHDVYAGVGLQDIARGTAKKIRVVELDYRAAGIGQSRNDGEGGISLNSSPVAVGGGTWDIKRILGDVGIEADGSARFTVPAMASIFLQVLDERGHVIQTTRSWDTVRPGEKKACRGCHAKQDANFYPHAAEDTLAWQKPPQTMQPFYGETRGFSFIKEVQPILDAKCVSCHDGSNPQAPSFDGTLRPHDTLEQRRWSEAYLNLTHAQKKELPDPRTGKVHYFFHGDPQHDVTNWIDKMSRPTEVPPYSAGAATSRLMHMLEQGHGGVNVTEEERHKFAAWLDLLVPFIGEYREANDWSDEDLAFYDYFETKRHKHQLEEKNEIRKWLGEEIIDSPLMSPVNQGYRALEISTRQNHHDHMIVALRLSAAVDRLDLSVPGQIVWADGTVMDLQAGVNVLSPPRIASELKFSGVNPEMQIKIFGRWFKDLPAAKNFGHQDLWSRNITVAGVR